MRIISGTAKGHTLKVPRSVKDLRPAQSAVRAAVFSILGGRLKDAKVLDLFAGTGAYGIEALSRGAAFCDFVDISREATLVIKQNLNHTRLLGKAAVFQQDAFRFAKKAGAFYDIIFAAPPYALGGPPNLLADAAGLLRRSGVLVFEHRKGVRVPEVRGASIIDRRIYGQTGVSFLEGG